MSLYVAYIKPFFDSLIALIGLLLNIPTFLLLCVVLSLINRGTPFFTQIRPGKNGKLFKIIKFKTMTDARDKEGNLLPDEERLSKVGKVVRKLSLDEIPQLLNVLKGEMSLIGPRPLLPEYLQLYNKSQTKRHLVRPGITGWAQVNGRNAISWQQKFEYDIWYVEHINFQLDFRILVKTIKKVLISEGINANGHATTENFNGKN